MVQLTDPQFSASAPIYQAIRISATPRALRARYRCRGIDRRRRAGVSTARPHSRHPAATRCGPKANGHTAWLRCTRRSRWMSSLRLASRDASPMVPALSGGRAAPFHSRRTPVSTRFRVRCQAHPRRSHDGADRLGRTPRGANSGLTCVISEQHASSGLLSQRSTSKFAAMPVAISGLGGQETG